jgi:hypothetical protein
VPDSEKCRLLFSITNVGLRIELPLIPATTLDILNRRNVYKAVLNVQVESGDRVAIPVERFPDGHYLRVVREFDLVPAASLKWARPQTLYIKEQARRPGSTLLLHGIEDVSINFINIAARISVEGLSLSRGYPGKIDDTECVRGGWRMDRVQNPQVFEFQNSDGGRFIIIIGVKNHKPWRDVLTDAGIQMIESD